MFGRMYSRKAIWVAWALIFVGFNGLYFPMFVQGWMGMPRRYYDYLPRFHDIMVLSTVASWVLIAGLIVFFGTLIVALKRGAKAPANPWGAKTLEWQAPSPPPHENFGGIPTVTEGPYAYR